MIKFTVNNNQFCIKGGVSVLEACEFVGITVPKFCYHQNISVAGNCRMCLVEIANSPKPVASCALPILNNMKVFVNTPLVKKARENVLEMLLLNHPLDCPICDQAGECDLQDQSRMFGLESSRFFFKKRGVENKECGPVIKTIMTRCIHCTRCVRFNSEISGNDLFGTLNRGTSTEIGFYKKSTYSSEISGNVIDLCPVGALTSNFYAFKARPWEALTVESIDLTDGLGSNVYINVKENQITRVFPKVNKQINGSFISDRARFSFDNIISNRLVTSNELKDLKLEKYWISCIKEIKKDINNKKNKKILFLSTPNADLDSLMLLKKIQFLGQDNLISKTAVVSRSDLKSNFFCSWLTNPILDIDSSRKICIIICSNPRVETPLINTKVFVKHNLNNYNIFGFSSFSGENNNTKFTNLNLSTVLKIIESKYIDISRLFKLALRPLVIFNENLLKKTFNSNSIIGLIKTMNPSSVLIKTSIFTNSSGQELLNTQKINAKLLSFENYDYILASNIDDSSLLSKKLNSLKANNLLWLNTHKSEITTKLNNVKFLSSKTEYEEENTFMNVEERIQKTYKSMSSLTKSVSMKELLLSFINVQSKYNLISSNQFEIYKSHLQPFVEMLKKMRLFETMVNTPIYNQEVANKNFINKETVSSVVSQYPVKSTCEDSYSYTRNLQNSKAMQIISQNMRKNFTNLAHKEC